MKQLVNEFTDLSRPDLIKIMRDKLEALGFEELDRKFPDNPVVFGRDYNLERFEGDFVAFDVLEIIIERKNLYFRMPYGEIDNIKISINGIGIRCRNILFEIR